MITRTRILLAILVALIAAVAFIGPNRVQLIVLLAAVAFLGTILLGVFHGTRDALRRGQEDADLD
jgi:uncharacterized membrane protein YhaH (DUF805 family)